MALTGALIGNAASTISAVAAGTSGNVLTSNGTTWTSAAPAGGGGVSGPGSSTNNGIATWNGAGGTALFSRATPLISSGGIMTNSNQPAFLARMNGNSGSITGDSTVVTFPYNATTFDQGSNFNTGTGTYVCPVTGLYQFSVNTFFAQSAGGTNTYYGTWINVNGATVFYFQATNFFSIATGFQWANSAILLNCNATDSVTIAGQVAGNASKNIVIGSGSTFSGFLVC